MNPALFSQEAEGALLGSILINPAALNDLEVSLSVDDFYVHKHRWVWEVFGALKQRGMETDVLTVQEQLDQAGKLSPAGGPAFLAALVGSVASSLNAASYARLVFDMATRRRLLAFAGEVAKRAHTTDNDVEEAIALSVNDLRAILEQRGAQKGMIHIREAVSAAYDRLAELAKLAPDQRMTGVPTGRNVAANFSHSFAAPSAGTASNSRSPGSDIAVLPSPNRRASCVDSPVRTEPSASVAASPETPSSTTESDASRQGERQARTKGRAYEI